LVLGDQLLKLADQVHVTAQRQVGVRPQLQGPKPELLEPGHFALSERLVDEVSQRRSAPQPETLVEQLARGRGRPGRQLICRLGHEV
jgi:hypothetical protein